VTISHIALPLLVVLRYKRSRPVRVAGERSGIVGETIELEPGEYSSGSLRDEEMVAMFDTIAAITDCVVCARLVGAAEALLEVDQFSRGHSCGNGWVLTGLGENIEQLFDHVGSIHTPAGYRFGAHEGDGACYGVWADEGEE
jgi:hypothetical protein